MRMLMRACAISAYMQHDPLAQAGFGLPDCYVYNFNTFKHVVAFTPLQHIQAKCESCHFQALEHFATASYTILRTAMHNALVMYATFVLHKTMQQGHCCLRHFPASKHNLVAMYATATLQSTIRSLCMPLRHFKAQCGCY